MTRFSIRLILGFAVILLTTTRSIGQVSDYIFSASTTSYKPLAEGLVLTPATGCIQDTTFPLIALPFSFTYCGVNYDSIGISENGFIRFGASANTLTTHVLRDQTAIISAFAQDLSGCATEREMSVLTLGTSPNRQFIIQWQHWGFFPGGTDELQFQVVLFESSNQIQVRYGEMLGTTSSLVTTGISGVLADDVQARTTETDWMMTAAGADSSLCTYTAAVKPAYGLIFQWTQADSAVNMTFSAFISEYTAYTVADITSLTAVPGCYDDQAFAPITIPFDFYYHDLPFNTIGVHANGYAKLGGVAPTSYTNVLSAQLDILSVFNHDLYGCATGRDISYGVIGAAPNRIFIVQWKNWGFYNSGLNEFSAQIRLHESDLSIRYMYGECTPVSAKNVTVGISGNNVSDFHIRRVNANWAFSSKGVSNTATCAFNTTTFPAEGLTYVFTPTPPCTGVPTAGITYADAISVCPGEEVLFGLTGADSNIAIDYQWQTAVHPDSVFTPVFGMTDSTLTLNIDTVIYVRCMLTCTVSGLTASSTPIGVTILTLPDAVLIGDTLSLGCTGDMQMLEVETDSSYAVQWLNHGVEIPGAVATTYAASTSGIYSARVSDGSCFRVTESSSVHIYDLPQVVDITASIDSACAGTEVFLSADAAESMVVIFQEGWNSASYAANNWTIENDLGNWTGWTGYTPAGAFAPTAFFTWTPAQLNYTSSVVSREIDGTGYTDIFVDYKLLLDNYLTGSNESFKVEYKDLDASEWTVLEVFSSSGISDDSTFERTMQLLSGCAGQWFQLRFTAFGINSFDIDAWGIDDIVVYGEAPYSYTWTSDPAGFYAEGQNVSCSEPVAGTYQYFVTVNQLLTGCNTTSAGETVVFTLFDTYYADADGDGFGDPDSLINACGLPTGYLVNALDCDDTQAAKFPGNTEICDGLDNDCDGFIDNFIVATVTPAGPLTICNGSGALLTATSGPGYTYQWKKNGANIGGATGMTYNATKAGNYSVLISVAPSCSALSNSVSLTVNPAPGATITNTDGTNNLCIDPSIKLKANNGTGFTWQWMKNGVNIAGATSITYSATTTGNYRVVVTNAFGCSKTSASVNIIYACKEALSENADTLVVYPNPSSGEVSLNITNSEIYAGFVTIEVYDMFGHPIHAFPVELTGGTASAQWVFPQELPSGVYIFRVVSDTGVRSVMVDLIR